MTVLELITLLVFLSTLFMFLNTTVIKLPSTIGLMLIAMIMSSIIILLGFVFPALTMAAEEIVAEIDFYEVLMNVMLNFLLFAGALSVNVRNLLDEKAAILAFALLGTLISTFLVAFMVFFIFPLLGFSIPFIYCLLFGALISPTDPIAVLSIINKVGVSKRLESQIAGESLFNDGVGAVLFLTILAIARAQAGVHELSAHGLTDISVWSIGTLFVKEVFGGILLGAVFGYLGFKLLDFIDNERVELEVLVTMSLVLVGGWLAHQLGVSAPLAMVVLGLFLTNQGREGESAHATGEYVFKFWHLLDEALNAMLFILIGFEIVILFDSFTWDNLVLALTGIGIVLVARWVSVIVPMSLVTPIKRFERGTVGVLTWGGLRGGISVALALSLSSQEWIHENIRETIILTTYSIVVFSIYAQGLTIEQLMKRFTSR